MPEVVRESAVRRMLGISYYVLKDMVESGKLVPIDKTRWDKPLFDKKHVESMMDPDVYALYKKIEDKERKSKIDIVEKRIIKSRFKTHIRNKARQNWEYHKKEFVCTSCGYDKHVEICHIKPLASFPESSTSSEINHISNLIALCPNCHWEFDNGFLSKEDLIESSQN